MSRDSEPRVRAEFTEEFRRREHGLAAKELELALARFARWGGTEEELMNMFREVLLERVRRS